MGDKLFNFARHLQLVHNKTAYVTYRNEFDKMKEEKKKKKAATNSSVKRPAATASTPSVSSWLTQKKPKLEKGGDNLKQSNIRSYIGKDPVLNVCAGMVVENGFTFSSYDSPCMQLLAKWGKLGIGDESEAAINSVNVRERVQDEAGLLRKQIKRALEGKVVHLCADMASRDGRCFLGEEIVVQQPGEFLPIMVFIFRPERAVF